MEKAQRRFNHRKILAKRKTHGKCTASDPDLTGKALGKKLHTAAACSCFMCGNQRKYRGALTKQEKIQQSVSIEKECG